MAVGSAGVVPAATQDAIGTLALLMITVALTAIGLSAQLSAMRRTGLRPLVLGGLLWVTVGASSLGLQQLSGQL